MNEKQWYYSTGNDRKGPIDESAAKALIDAGVIGSETLVWADGMADWEPAYRHLRGLVPPAPGQPGRGQRAMAGTGGGRYAEPIGFGAAFAKGFRKFGDFSGRASRGEFWWFILGSILVSIVCSVVDASLFDPIYDPTSGYVLQLSPLNWLWSLIVLIPSLALGSRRLHDTGRSGWWQLLILTGIGVILLIVWWAQAGDKEANAHG